MMFSVVHTSVVYMLSIVCKQQHLELSTGRILDPCLALLYLHNGHLAPETVTHCALLLYRQKPCALE